MVELRFVAVRRSGHHAVINWALKQLAGSYLFINDPLGPLFGEVSAGAFTPTDVVADDGLAGRLVGGPRGLVSRRGAAPYDWLVYNLEDMPLRPWDLGSGEVRTVLVLRDPFNLMASRIARRAKRPVDELGDAEAVGVWKGHARHFLGGGDFLKVNFNRWFVSPDYRRSLAPGIGFDFTDEGLQDVPAWGCGSSFDGRSRHGSAQSMTVLRRYSAHLGDDRFWSLFDGETLDLARGIFGMSPVRRLLQ